MTSPGAPPRQIHQTGLVTLPTSLPFTLKSTGRKTVTKMRWEALGLRLWGIGNQVGLGGITPLHMNGPMVMFAQGQPSFPSLSQHRWFPPSSFLVCYSKSEMPLKLWIMPGDLGWNQPKQSFKTDLVLFIPPTVKEKNCTTCEIQLPPGNCLSSNLNSRGQKGQSPWPLLPLVARVLM